MTDDTSASAAAQPLPYREMTHESYARLAAREFTVEEVAPGTLVLRGPCPRCHAVIDVPVVSGIFRSTGLTGGVSAELADPTATSQVEPMMCTCEDEHPERPHGAYGCGAYWALELSRQDT